MLLLAAVGLLPAGLPLSIVSPCLASAFASQDYGGQDPGDVPGLNPLDLLPSADELRPRYTPKSKAARKKSLEAEKGTNKKTDATRKTKNTGTSTKGASTGQSTLSTERVRRAQVARLPQQEVNKAIEAAGLERWKQANPKLKPDIVHGDHFVMFSKLSRDQATSTLKVMDGQYGQLKRLLGAAAADWVEKVSLYVFTSRKDFIEFVRSVEKREDVDVDEFSSGRLSVPQPYVAVVDPAGGTNEEPGGTKRKTRGRRGEEGQGAGGIADRTLNGLLTEALASSALISAGRPPRWLALGVGSYLAAHVEPRSPYSNQLRRTAFANWQQGWLTKSMEVLGDQATVDSLRAVGFALVEAMMSEEVSRRYFPAFVQGMLQGGEKLDETLETVYGGTTRAEFIKGGDEWIAAHYGQLR